MYEHIEQVKFIFLLAAAAEAAMAMEEKQWRYFPYYSITIPSF
jgi:hypothetical protein